MSKACLCKEATVEEVKHVVFDLGIESTQRAWMVLMRCFSTLCWDVIQSDVLEAVKDFLSGTKLPISFTATSIVLVPKTRQTGDNILLAQEIIHYLGVKKTDWNVALKLDIAKAYDKVDWIFLESVLLQLGFPPRWIELVRNCISNCWFPILINGSLSSFFKSTMGLRQDLKQSQVNVSVQRNAHLWYSLKSSIVDEASRFPFVQTQNCSAEVFVRIGPGSAAEAPKIEKLTTYISCRQNTAVVLSASLHRTLDAQSQGVVLTVIDFVAVGSLKSSSFVDSLFCIFFERSEELVHQKITICTGVVAYLDEVRDVLPLIAFSIELSQFQWLISHQHPQGIDVLDNAAINILKCGDFCTESCVGGALSTCFSFSTWFEKETWFFNAFASVIMAGRIEKGVDFDLISVGLVEFEPS
ncbi:hypothetical protein Sango_2834400 [Sesamum angolense]|uniref:Reverse transcriptase domain-containing protein n=1 Tax=Sesamum angolense TaxID=2727404 RepID=A0AAE1W0F1_9LAMI|nr:hypothetical protein Sango_2834400 [Sesamum angolense]